MVWAPTHARGDDGQSQVVGEHEVRHQQEVQVTAVTGQQNHRVLLNGLLKLKAEHKAQVRVAARLLAFDQCLRVRVCVLTLWRPSSLMQTLLNRVLKTLQSAKAKKRTVLSCILWAISSKMAPASSWSSSAALPVSWETCAITPLALSLGPIRLPSCAVLFFYFFTTGFVILQFVYEAICLWDSHVLCVGRDETGSRWKIPQVIAGKEEIKWYTTDTTDAPIPLFCTFFSVLTNTEYWVFFPHLF